MFNNQYKGKRVLITGHTGFKGSWLTQWLNHLGAEVIGFSLPPPTVPNHFESLKPKISSIISDLSNKGMIEDTFRFYKPDIVFHLAAQSLVRQAYKEPVETFTSNVLGTIQILEACRLCETTRAVIIVTSDKCYENKEWVWGYRENEQMGGYDPYSASKGCVELIVSCWRNSFFNVREYGNTHQTLLTSVRAGNVIGGGDWAADRLIPDIMRSVSKNDKVIIRNPNSTRPWQHVLEPLSGYLLVGQRLLEGKVEFAEAWNFGPSDERNINVAKIVELAKEIWPKIEYSIQKEDKQLHEASALRLDSSKARTKLKWQPIWNTETAIIRTVNWYRSFYENHELRTVNDLESFVNEAKFNQIEWAME